MYDYPRNFSEPVRADPEGIILFVWVLIAAAIAYNWFNKKRAARAEEGAKLVRENGLLERYKPVLLQLGAVAPDARILKATVNSAELTGTLQGHKTYIILEHSTLLKPVVNVTTAVVTPTGTRKRTTTYNEPANALDIWQDVRVEVEKLIDNV